MNVVITGANRGIGLEFCRQCLSVGDTVFAGAREPSEAKELSSLKLKGALTVLPCDVSSDESVAAFAKKIASPVDLLINNAGMRIRPDGLSAAKPAELLRILDVNAVGALRVTTALLPNLRKAKAPRVVSISSQLGSIEDNRSGDAYGYRMSKAALNMAMRTLAADLWSDGIIAIALSPGWVQTDMGGKSAPTPVEESVRGMLSVITKLQPKDSGSFLDYRGQRLPF